MQSSDRVLAWRYGRAVFEAASVKKEEAKVLSDFHAAQPSIRDLMPFIRDPRVSTVDKKKKLEGTLGNRVSPVTMRFLELLITKKRFELLPMIMADFGKLLADKNNVAKAHVRTARPLSPDAQKKLREALKHFNGKDIELDIKEDPELIGGVVVRLGDWVLDSSLRGQLRKLKETINGN